MTKLHITNMKSPQCTSDVQEILKKHGYNPLVVDTGKAVVKETIDDFGLTMLHSELKKIGFGLIQDEKKGRINQIKCCIEEMMTYHREQLKEMTFPDYLKSRITDESYRNLNKLFKEEVGMNMGQYVLRKKIELTKQLFTIEGHTLESIAKDLGFHSKGYLSAQFKEITGMTPSRYRATGMEMKGFS